MYYLKEKTVSIGFSIKDKSFKLTNLMYENILVKLIFVVYYFISAFTKT